MTLKKSSTALLIPAALLAVFTSPARCQEPSRKPRYGPEYERRVFKGAADGELNYGWLAPLASKAGEKYPLVICLHGSGGSVRASAILTGPEMRKKYPSFVLVGECDRPFVWAYTDALKRLATPEQKPQEKLPALIAAVRSLIQTEAIDPARIYIIGQSMGGAGSWSAIARHPELFAAAVPICGLWLVEDAPKMAAVPVWAFHGADDRTVPVSFSRDLTAAITKAGGTVKYTEYPGVGHDSWNKACDEPELWPWLFAQKKATARPGASR